MNLIARDGLARYDASLFDETYYERGLASGISGYMNYSWMPETTLRMAHFMISGLPIQADDCVLDFGCAKGFVVKALRILGIESFGVDVSAYAIGQAPAEVAPYCRLIAGCRDPALFQRHYDWLLSKDVFEHIAEEELRVLLTRARDHIRRMFIVVPFGQDDGRGKFVIPAYDSDITHITVKPRAWWDELFALQGWRIRSFAFRFTGVKENWTRAWHKGNGFYILES
jgi:SAM-dependent methyltransferase